MSLDSARNKPSSRSNLAAVCLQSVIHLLTLAATEEISSELKLRIQVKETIFNFLRLTYLLQVELPVEKTEQLGKDVFWHDFTQNVWHDNKNRDQIIKSYVRKMRALILPPESKKDEIMSINRKEEYQHVIQLINNSSVVPEGPHQRYYIIAIEWFKRWEEYVTSESEEKEEPGPINTKSQLR